MPLLPNITLKRPLRDTACRVLAIILVCCSATLLNTTNALPGPSDPKQVPPPVRNPKASATASGFVSSPPQQGKSDTAPQPEIWTVEQRDDAVAACRILLAGLDLDYEALPAVRKGPCGAPAPVRLSRIGGEQPITIKPAATLNCAMVEATHRWLTGLQSKAIELFGAPIVEARNVSSYVCRNRYNNANGRLSEHALANALDIASVRLANRKKISVDDHWGQTEREIEAKIAAEQAKKARQLERDNEPDDTSVASDLPPLPSPNRARRTLMAAKAAKIAKRKRMVTRTYADDLDEQPPRARFLRYAHRMACEIFGTVLGPEANDAHLDHFHLDLARRRNKSYCQ